MSTQERGLRTVLGALILCALTALLPTAASAKHSPPETACMDCHALSRSTVVPGTHLIKNESFISSLSGWSAGQSLPCLYCHRSDRSGSVKMKGVEAHFSTSVTSKHTVPTASGFGNDTGGLECLDCHNGAGGANFTQYVINNTSTGINTVHGFNSTGSSVNVTITATLVVNASTSYALNATNYTRSCMATTCHGGSVNGTFGSATARKSHAMNTTSLGGVNTITLGSSGNVPSSCNSCHSTHRSDKQGSLMVLQTDGTVNQTGASPVTASNCGGCHAQDDTAAGNPWGTLGHGKANADMGGGAIGYSCTACHDPNVPHSFATNVTTNKLRFSLPVNNVTAVSTLRREPPYDNAYSICGNCHQTNYDVPPHGGYGDLAGCNDCHEPHGINVSYSGVTNKVMLRRFIPKTDTAGAPVYGSNLTTGTWELIVANTTTSSYYYDASGTGECDNSECHQGVTVTNTNGLNVSIYPLTGYVNSTAHSGQAQSTASDCLGCHNHTDSTGGMGAVDSCTSCHGQPPPAAASGYSQDENKTPHIRHAGASTLGGLGMACSTCHAKGTDSSTHNTTSSPSYASVYFNVFGVTTYTYNSTTKTCTSNYCHSDGKGTYQNQTWNANNWNTTDLTCHDCHGGIDSTTKISSNAHDAHVNSGITCQYCHYATLTAISGTEGTYDTATNINSTNHINGSVNLAYPGAALQWHGVNVTFTWNSSAGSCSSASCHIGLTWNVTSYNCNSCHTTGGNDVTNFNGTDGTMSLISLANWTSAGHGSTANGTLTCTSCHDKSQGHDFAMNGTNPFRLKDVNGATAGLMTCQDNVSGCHLSTTATNETALNLSYGTIMNHDRASMVTAGGSPTIATWRFTPKCVDCHDPHGDASNAKMIQADMWDNGSNANYVKTLPVNDTSVVTFTNYAIGSDTTGSSYANMTSPYASLCQKCHLAASTMTSYKLGTSASASGHPIVGGNPGDCNTCHKHDSAFKPSGCSGCHGSAATGQFWPANGTFGINGTATTRNTTGADDGGAHELHIAWIASKPPFSMNVTALYTNSTAQTAICGYCHATPGQDGDHGSTANLPADVFASTLYSKNLTGGADINATFATAADTCTNVDCHAQYGTTSGSAEITTPSWYLANSHSYNSTVMNCSACHNSVVGTGGYSSHGPHNNTNAYAFGAAITCSLCHGPGLNWTSAAATGTPPTANHMNGAFNMTGSASVSITYGGTFRSTWGSCGVNNCHRADASLSTPANISAYNWNSTQAGSCDQCHMSPASTGRHTGHLNSNWLNNTNNSLECYLCHNASATSGGLASLASHINNADNVNFNSSANYEANNATIAGTGTNASCTNVKCHFGVATPLWGSTAASCVACHSNTWNRTSATSATPMNTSAGGTSVAGKHQKHAGAVTVYTACDGCHGTVSGAYTATGGAANHMNKTVEISGFTFNDTSKGGVNWSSTVGGGIDDGTCTGTACHGAGTPSWNNTAVLAAGCFDCHGGTVNATEDGIYKPLNNTTPNPINCTAQYNVFGHGNNTTLPGSGKAGPGYLYSNTNNSSNCYACHDETSQHTPAASSTDPFRLGATYATNTNGLCITCHTTMVGHSKALVGDSGAIWPNSAYAFKCVDCHDPHGDTNWYMVRSHINAPQTTTDTTYGSDSYGTPADSAAVSVTFTSIVGNGAGSYGIDAAPRGVCEVCHVDTTNVSYYNVGTATNTHNATTDCKSCHKHTASFAATCAGCHNGSDTNAPQIFSQSGTMGASYDTGFGSHLKTTSGETLTSTTDFTAQCKKCHPGHTGGYTVPLPSTAWAIYGASGATQNMQSRLGIDYGTGGIHLGGTATGTATDEANICWGCHSTNSISEWSTNNNAVTGASTYDYGSLYTTQTGTTIQANWTAGGYWRSGTSSTGTTGAFYYKTGTLKSIHTGNVGTNSTVLVTTISGSLYANNSTAASTMGSGVSETLEASVNIRCSYCHDVHDHKIPGGSTIGPSLAPHLRGTYMGNPFPEDGAPVSTLSTYYVTMGSSLLTRVPRGGTAYTQQGGYFINQNWKSYTTSTSTATYAGLCILCHNMPLDSMDFKLGEGLWVGTNGHSAVLYGSARSTVANIFDYNHGRPTPVTTNTAQGATPIFNMAMQARKGGGGYAYRGTETGDNAGSYDPTTSGRYAMNSYNWAANVTTGDTAQNYHAFPCSKCHNPHGSRLPKLMITNCLDIGHNTWDDNANFEKQTLWTNTKLPDRGRTTAYFVTAINCHRRDPGISTTWNSGWNKVTPW